MGPYIYDTRFISEMLVGTSLVNSKLTLKEHFLEPYLHVRSGTFLRRLEAIFIRGLYILGWAENLRENEISKGVSKCSKWN